jgi:hypothetical protein
MFSTFCFHVRGKPEMVRTSARPVARFGLCNLAHGRVEFIISGAFSLVLSFCVKRKY